MSVYTNDFCGFGTLTNAEVEEMDATMAGVFEVFIPTEVENARAREMDQEWAMIEMERDYFDMEHLGMFVR